MNPICGSNVGILGRRACSKPKFFGLGGHAHKAVHPSLIFRLGLPEMDKSVEPTNRRFFFFTPARLARRPTNGYIFYYWRPTQPDPTRHLSARLQQLFFWLLPDFLLEPNPSRQKNGYWIRILGKKNTIF